MDCRDIWGFIYSFLEGKDVISCSEVNRTMYYANCNNLLWYRLMLKETRKKIMKSRINILYDDKLNYKILYLSMFHQKYNSRFIDFYKDSFFSYICENSSWYEKLLILPMFVIPASIIISPLALIGEGVNYFHHKRRHYEFCDCDSCLNKMNHKICCLDNKEYDKLYE